MASSNVDTMPQPKKANVSKAQAFRQFLYTKEEGFLGRGCNSWAKIGIFYLIFYSCLAGFFAASLAIFFTTVDANHPSLQDMQSLLKGNPGMGFRPMPNLETTLVSFEQGNGASYKIYADHLKAFTSQYENENQQGENFMDCSAGKTQAQQDKVCRFDVKEFGSVCRGVGGDFGYDDGMPCVLLKLNKIFNWVPIPDNRTYEQHQIGTPKFNDHIGVSCEGENPSDRENLGPLKFFPEKGIPHFYFPYKNQEHYRAPAVMVRFMRPKNGVLIQVWCKAWSGNIYHHKNDKAGSVHFELLID